MYLCFFCLFLFLFLFFFFGGGGAVSVTSRAAETVACEL